MVPFTVFVLIASLLANICFQQQQPKILMRVRKNNAGRNEKQIINFMWPKP